MWLFSAECAKYQEMTWRFEEENTVKISYPWSSCSQAAEFHTCDLFMLLLNRRHCLGQSSPSVPVSTRQLCCGAPQVSALLLFSLFVLEIFNPVSLGCVPLLFLGRSHVPNLSKGPPFGPNGFFLRGNSI